MSIELEPHTAGDWWKGLGPITYKINDVAVNITNATPGIVIIEEYE